MEGAKELCRASKQRMVRQCGGEGTEGQWAWRLEVEGQGVDYLSCCHDQMPGKELFKGIVP